MGKRGNMGIGNGKLERLGRLEKLGRLGDVCTIQSGGTPSRSKKEFWDGGTVPWVKISDFDGIYLDSTEEKITEKGLAQSSAKLFTKGTILYSIFATLGEVCILDIDAATNQAIAGITIKDEDIDQKYLYYFLCSIKPKIMKIGRGVAQNNINLSILRSLEIPIPSLEEQKKVAGVLDAATALAAKRRRQLALLDTLTQSRFVEMFGDPVINDKNFPIMKGEKFFKLSNGKTVTVERRFDAGIPAYGGNGISWYTDASLIDDDTLVVGRVGFQSGNVRFVEGPLWVTDNAMYVLKYDKTKFDLVFLSELMQKINFSKFQDMGDLKKITQKPFMEFNYIQPTLALQKDFVNFKKEVDRQKVALRRSLTALTTLKSALMQEYFGN